MPQDFGSTVISLLFNCEIKEQIPSPGVSWVWEQSLFFCLSSPALTLWFVF